MTREWARATDSQHVQDLQRGLASSPVIQSRQTRGKRELSRKSDDFALFPPCDWLWSAQSGEPLGIGELPEVELWTAKKRLRTAGMLHFGDLLLIRCQADRIQGERHCLVFDFEGFLIDPHGDLFSGKPIFPKETPVSEPYVSMLVEMTSKLRGVQHPREHLFWVGPPQRPAQHVEGAVSPILAIAMGKMMLAIDAL